MIFEAIFPADVKVGKLVLIPLVSFGGQKRNFILLIPHKRVFFAQKHGYHIPGQNVYFGQKYVKNRNLAFPKVFIAWIRLTKMTKN